MPLFRNKHTELTATRTHTPKRRERNKSFTSAEIELHLPPTLWKCIHVEPFSFSSFRLMFRNCVRCVCHLFSRRSLQLLRWLCFCIWICVFDLYSVFSCFSKLQKRPSHHYFVFAAKKKYIQKILSSNRFTFDRKKKRIVHIWISCVWKHCVNQYESMAN